MLVTTLVTILKLRDSRASPRLDLLLLLILVTLNLWDIRLPRTTQVTNLSNHLFLSQTIQNQYLQMVKTRATSLSSGSTKYKTTQV